MAANDINALVRVIALLLGQNEERAEEIVKWAYGEKKKENQKEETNTTSSLSKKKKVVKEKQSLVFPYSSEQFMATWNELILQPKWKGKTDSALQLSLNKLAKYDEAFSIELMEAAIERGWVGVVFDDTDEKYRQWKAGKQGRQPKDKNDVNALWNR